MKMYSIDRASRLASRAVASSSTNDERGRFPINRQSHSSDPRHRTTRARVLFLCPRGWGRLTTDHDSSLTPPPKYLSRRQKSHAIQTHTGPDRTIDPIDRLDRPVIDPIDPSSTRSTRSIDPIDPIDRPDRPDRRRRHSRARRWRHDDDVDDDLDDDAVVGGVEERGETGGESSGERVGGIGTTRYARWDDDAR